MAATVALNAAFVRMGFSNEAAAILTDATKENLEIGTLQYFDDKGIKILCASLRKPGGTKTIMRTFYPGDASGSDVGFYLKMKTNLPIRFSGSLACRQHMYSRKHHVLPQHDFAFLMEEVSL
jgi:hypothetical protein